jgi:Cys-rich protein (TIGR01571 family)
MSEWKFGICDCCGIKGPECCIACLCPFYPYSKILSSMGTNKIQSSIPYCGNVMYPACIYGTTFYAAMLGPCIYCCTLSSAVNAITILSLVPCAMHCATRSDIRGKNIKGNCCEDCCTVMCCYSCALVQETVQLDDVGKPPALVNGMKEDELTGLMDVPITSKDVKGN